MAGLKSLFVVILTILLLIEIVKYVHQERGEFIISGTPLKIEAHTLIGTDDYLYAARYCLDWEGNIIWENPELSEQHIVYLGDALFAETYSTQKTSGIALLTLEGEILWQGQVGKLAYVGIGASRDLLAVGTREGILGAFSKTGTILWKYYNTSVIDQIAVAPDSSCVVFIDHDENIKCVSEGKLIWSEKVGNMSVPLHNRTIAFAPDSSFLVYGSKVGDPELVACTLDGTELWSVPLKKTLQSVAIIRDGHVIAGCHKYIYRFTADGTFLWESEIGGDDLRLAITPGGDYIVVGSSNPYRLFVLNGEGAVLWKVKSSDYIFAVAISPNGEHIAFSNHHTELFIFSNPPESG